MDIDDMMNGIDGLTLRQMLVCVTLVRKLAALERGLNRQMAVLVYVPGDAPYIPLPGSRSDKYQLCADSSGNFDLWENGDLAKPNVSVADIIRLWKRLVQIRRETERKLTKPVTTEDIKKMGVPRHSPSVTFPDGTVERYDSFPERSFRARLYCKYCHKTHRNWHLMKREDFGIDVIVLCGECEHTSNLMLIDNINESKLSLVTLKKKDAFPVECGPFGVYALDPVSGEVTVYKKSNPMIKAALAARAVATEDFYKTWKPKHS